MHPISIEKFADMTIKSNKDMNKKELIKATGNKHCAAIGNGRNDELMLKEAVLSIAIMDKEGMYGKLFKEADLCVRSMQDGLDLLLNPNRIIAGLRG